MRNETREYKFDWMLWNTFAAAARLKSGTDKEYRTMLKYIPYFNRIVEVLLSAGEPGQKFLEICAKYMENLTFAKKREKDGHYDILFFPVHFLRHGYCAGLSGGHFRHDDLCL